MTTRQISLYSECSEYPSPSMNAVVIGSRYVSLVSLCNIAFSFDSTVTLEPEREVAQVKKRVYRCICSDSDTYIGLITKRRLRVRLPSPELSTQISA